MHFFTGFLVVSLASLKTSHAAQECMGQMVDNSIIADGGKQVFYTHGYDQNACEQLCASRSDCWSWTFNLWPGWADSCLLFAEKGHVQPTPGSSGVSIRACGQKKFECPRTSFKCKIVDPKLGPQCVQAPGGIKKESCEQACVKDDFTDNNDNIQQKPTAQTMSTAVKSGPKQSDAVAQSAVTAKWACTCHHVRNYGKSCFEDRRPKCESRPDEPAFDWHRGSCAESGYAHCCKYRHGAGPYYSLWYKNATMSCPSDVGPSLGPCNTQQVADLSSVSSTAPLTLV